LGTSVVKASLFDEGGNAVADAVREMAIHYPGPGLAEQNPDNFYVAALETIREAVEKAGIGPASVAAIAYDGQMAGAMGIDRSWNALTPWYPSALDVRYQPYLKRMVDIAGDRLMQLAGAMPFAAPRMLWWQQEYPEHFERIYKVVILANYVAGRMAGLNADDAFVDPSYLNWIGLSDTANRAWSPELAEMFNLPLDKLPHIVPATTIIGKLSPEAAAACGLVAGVPLVAGAGDQVATALGAGLVESGQLVDVAGTFSVLATCLDSFLADTRYGMLQSMAAPFSDSHWYPMMYIGGGGLTHRWFRDQFGRQEKARAQAEGSSPYQLLDEAAANLPPGSDGLIFIPHLAGRSCPPDLEIRGSWVGFTWTHTKAHFYRAVLEGIAYDYAEVLAVIREYFPGTEFIEVRVMGGGANSVVWNQIKADVLGLPYARLQREDVAALGCALMGGNAVGIYPDMAAAARQFAQVVSRVESRPAYHHFYRDYTTIYRQAFDSLRSIHQNLTPLASKVFNPDAGE